MDYWKQKQGEPDMGEYMMKMMAFQNKLQHQERITKLGNRYNSWGKVPNLKYDYHSKYPTEPWGKSPYSDNPYEDWMGNWKEIVEQRQKQKKEAEEAAKEKARKERAARISKRRANGVNRIRGL